MSNTKEILCLKIISISAFIASIAALILAFAKLDVPLSQLKFSFDRAINIVELVMGSLGLSATVFFITMGITLHKYNKELNETLRRSKEIDYTMQSNLKETIDALSSIESVANEKAIYIRLAKGRLMCKSTFSNNRQKKEGISYIQAYYTSKPSNKTEIPEDNEDIVILKNMTNNFQLDKDIRDSAQQAIDAIHGNNIQDSPEQEKKIKRLFKKSFQ